MHFIYFMYFCIQKGKKDLYMAAKINQEKGKVIEDIVSQWGTLSAEHLALLKDNLTITHYKKNEIIYKDFENPKNTFCLISGKVKIFKDGIGRNQIVRAIKPIEFFGYRAHFAQEDYRTSAMAIEACTIASFPITILEKLMEENHQICLYLIHSLARELGNSDERTVNLTQKHIRGRLAEALIFLKDNYGLEEDGYTLSIYLSREDLASMSNMTTSNAIRTLSAFATEQIIAIDGRKIKIIKEEELRKISTMG